MQPHTVYSTLYYGSILLPFLPLRTKVPRGNFVSQIPTEMDGSGGRYNTVWIYARKLRWTQNTSWCFIVCLFVLYVQKRGEGSELKDAYNAVTVMYWYNIVM